MQHTLFPLGISGRHASEGESVLKFALAPFLSAPVDVFQAGVPRLKLYPHWALTAPLGLQQSKPTCAREMTRGAGIDSMGSILYEADDALSIGNVSLFSPAPESLAHRPGSMLPTRLSLPQYCHYNGATRPKPVFHAPLSTVGLETSSTFHSPGPSIASEARSGSTSAFFNAAFLQF